MRAKPAAAALLGLLLAACATPGPPAYGPIGPETPFGYKDNANADGGHTVLARLPPHVLPADARLYWNRRAEELCPRGIAKRNIFRTDTRQTGGQAPYVHGGVGMGHRVTTAVEVEGYVYCKAAAGG